MPPKKKGKKNKEPEAPKDSNIADVTMKALLQHKEEEVAKEKNLALPQEVVAVQKETMQVTKEVREQKAQLAKQKEDQNDVYFFLHKKLDDNYDIIAELEGQLLREELDRKNREEKIQDEIEATTKNFNEQSAVLKSNLNNVDEKLYSLKDAGGWKNELEAKMIKLLRDLEDERKSHFAKMADIDRAGIREKEKLKMTLLSEMKEVKNKLSSMASESLSQTQIDARNDHNLNAEKLHKQGLVGNRIIKENVAVCNTLVQKKRDIQMSNEMQATMASREIAFQKQISHLTQKLSDLGNIAEEINTEVTDVREEMGVEEQTLLDAVKELEETLKHTFDSYNILKNRASRAVEAYNMEIWSSEMLGEFLNCCLEDCGKQAKAVIDAGGVLEGWNYSDAQNFWGSEMILPARLNDLSLAQRRSLFKYLLSELNGYKLKVEAAMERKNEREEKRRLAAQNSGESLSRGEYNNIRVFGDSSIPAGDLRTNIPAWDNYNTNTFLGNILAVTPHGKSVTAKVKSQGTQTSVGDVNYNFSDNKIHVKRRGEDENDGDDASYYSLGDESKSVGTNISALTQNTVTRPIHHIMRPGRKFV